LGCYGTVRNKNSHSETIEEGRSESDHTPIRRRWGTVDTFLHFQPLLLYSISSPNNLKICHTIKELYIHNIMTKHENNTLQKKIYNQFEKGTFSVERAPCMGTLDMSMGYT